MAGLFPADNEIISPLVRPNQQLQTGDIHALAVSEYAGFTETSLNRRSVLADWVPMRRITGTTTVHNYAIGETKLDKVEPGVPPPSHGVDISRASVTVDTLINARNVLPLLEEFQTQVEVRKHLGEEHGKELAKFRDQALFIQAIKAARMTKSAYAKGGQDVDGFKGGTSIQLGAAGDVTDPAKMYRAVSDLETAMAEKDVDWVEDGIILAFRPKVFQALRDAEKIVNGEYVTADGTTKEGLVFKTFGAPVVKTNNLPNTNITGHLLSNAGNSNGYDVDARKVAGVALSTRALLAGETIPLTSDVFYDKIWKCWFVDSHTAFAATPSRAEFAGIIELP